MGPAVPALEREELSKSMKFTDRIVGTRCCFGRGKRDVFGSFLLLTLMSREVGLNLWPEVTYRRGATIPAAQIHAA